MTHDKSSTLTNVEAAWKKTYRYRTEHLVETGYLIIRPFDPTVDGGYDLEF